MREIINGEAKDKDDREFIQREYTNLCLHNLYRTRKLKSYAKVVVINFTKWDGFFF
jgi:hypothetical protein